MRVIDLTLTIPRVEKECRRAGGPMADVTTVREAEWKIAGYTAMVYFIRHWGMAGTYLDLPGHIKELDDGTCADTYPLPKLYRMPATVIHLDRRDGSGKITAAELAAACPRRIRGGALILNALGRRRFDEIEMRSVYLGKDAVQWIVDTGVHLLVSDVYESNRDPQNVFWDLFAAHVSTVCLPVNLHLLDAPTARLTVLPLRLPGVTQLPCRVVAELAGRARSDR